MPQTHAFLLSLVTPQLPSPPRELARKLESIWKIIFVLLLVTYLFIYDVCGTYEEVSGPFSFG